MKIYTKRGDTGETDLFGGERVTKDHARVEAYGSVDELNACIGVARAEFSGDGANDIVALVDQIQTDLFMIGADLATPGHNAPSAITRVADEDVGRLEAAIDLLESQLPPLRAFILPGGSRPGAQFHVARTVCRRAERATVTLSASDTVNPHVMTYLNRLSDLLFVLARAVNQRDGVPESEWRPRSPA